MMIKITPISLSMPFNLGKVNCYLVENDADFILIDTGSSNQRAELKQELEDAGCASGNLKLIILTHGDFDHTGNAAYLRDKFSVQIAMHQDDSEMAEYGNMFFNRKQPNILLRKTIPVFLGFGKDKRFKPDLYIEDGDDLSAYGLDAKFLSIPGHSKDSTGILMANGDLFCGDLLENLEKPVLGSIMDDLDAANASVEMLKRLEINTVYPGHGTPFLMEEFIKPN